MLFKTKSYFLLALTAILLLQLGIAKAQTNIIPKPANIALGNGSFIINKQTSFSYPKKNESLKTLADYFSNHIQKISGMSLASNQKSAQKIEFKLVDIAALGREGYRLNVSKDLILLEANAKEGLFYGVQSLMQCLPAIRTNEALKVPFMEVTDYPRFSWRGMMLDVSRHFFSVETIKETIDLLASYKMNVFHWHLVDNEGWRLEIKKYPKLTSVGAWRDEVYGSRWYSKDSTLNFNDTYKYGGYYTQEQAKDVVAYAKARNITVIPEIEMPGHSGAALAAYPQFSCTGIPQAVPNSSVVGGFKGHRGINFEYCAGNDSTFLFLQDVMKEVMQIFPSEYIHVGGDEVEKFRWEECPKCQARMKAEHLKDTPDLQSYFIKRMENFLIANHKKLLGWDEILEGGLAPSATVMSWRGEKGGIEAAKQGHDVVMSPSNPLYFNRYQADPKTEPFAAGFSVNSLDKVYGYDPYSKALTAEQHKFIKGGQFAIWTENIATPEYLEYMLLPRLPAIAEALWTPVSEKNYDDFVKRLNQWHFNSWAERGISFYQGLYKKKY
ncbi:beta-N-acetylhexosaminidase [Pedobacter arcticus]|uniref:beta-N-acetylhexosaminidase n=1 Tax=Pedobacter arcticus TaxID=752140 RepID=UPI0002D644AA|nr:beta-N-acetylhexosaminidase [Pedobacter arcticus]